ncbi:prepilin peptidase [Amedibacillus sp. YH-ame6]
MEGIYFIFYTYSFFIGICIASFINVVIWRVPQKLSIAKGRSFCPNCKHELKWMDLIPIFSYLFLRGKCRYCGAKIPMRDTVIECIGGIFAVFCFWKYPFQLEALFVFILFVILLAITMIDFDTMEIPNGLVLMLFIPIIGMLFVQTDVSVIDRIVGFFSVSLPMYVLTRCIPDCFGGGDIKLIAVCGILLGWELTLFATFVSLLLGGGYAIYLLLRKKTEKDSYMAFGPYLSIGIMVSLLYGNEIIHSYLMFFGLI